ncbi:uncharacterized protein LOC126195640 [Schistocerca nitens]|uniref:uncharacterized protein LOC126195640 n=1 Tax=Schistocerca nitens TaxID=7011 RepID=UPI002117A018|nr:uncharacterized protein LOC126195640 [Schistocerca nitens]
MEATAGLAEAGSSSSSSELELLQWLLHWSGTMRYPRAGPWAGRAFYLLNAAASAAIVLFLCSQGVAIWREGTRDLDRFTLMLSTFNTIATWLFRLGHIAVHEHQFHYLSLQSTQSLVQAGKFSCYLTVVLVELFMYCWFGDDLITESENVTMAAYTAVTSLQGFPADVRKSLLIVMTRAQRPLRITAGGLFPFCRESFVSVQYRDQPCKNCPL